MQATSTEENKILPLANTETSHKFTPKIFFKNYTSILDIFLIFFSNIKFLKISGI